MAAEHNCLFVCLKVGSILAIKEKEIWERMLAEPYINNATLIY